MRHQTPEFKARWLNYGQPKRQYDKPTNEQVEKGKLRRAVELLDEARDLGEELMEVWDED